MECEQYGVLLLNDAQLYSWLYVGLVNGHKNPWKQIPIKDDSTTIPQFYNKFMNKKVVFVFLVVLRNHLPESCNIGSYQITNLQKFKTQKEKVILDTWFNKICKKSSWNMGAIAPAMQCHFCPLTRDTFYHERW